MYKAPSKEEFEAMPLAEKRVAVARDVVKLIEGEQILVGLTYLAGDAFGEEELVADEAARCATCYVCAQGAAVLSLFRLGAASPTTEGYDSEPLEQLGFDAWKMEVVFEENWGAIEEYPAFYEKYPHRDESRLRAIFENIIANDGDFKPEIAVSTTPERGPNEVAANENSASANPVETVGEEG